MANEAKQTLEQEFTKLRSRQKYSEYYHFVRLLGQGAFCSVYEAVDQATQETIAVKVSLETPSPIISNFPCNLK
jgi:serine/threonine protein kinase